jgi:hypothetical protein
LLIIHLRPRNVSASIPTRLNQQSVRYYKQLQSYLSLNGQNNSEQPLREA